MSSNARKLIVILGIICIIGFTVLAIISLYFFNVAINRKTVIVFEDNTPKEAPEPLPTPIDVKGTKWVEQQGYETWNIKTGDGLFLKAYFIKAKERSNKTVILAHGYTSQGKDMGSFAKYYYSKLGYNVLMPDDRGHGQSEGNYIGFGWLDRKDYLQWIDKVIESVGEDSQIVLHGISMGGATVMMVSGETLPPQVKAIIEDCGYTSVLDQLKFQLKQMYDLPEFPILNATSLMTKIRAGYFFEEASALNQVKKDKLPMLFIHGDQDTFVPTEMVYKLYEACNAPKDLLVVKGAGHAMSYHEAKKEYQKKIKSFLKKYIKD